MSALAEGTCPGLSSQESQRLPFSFRGQRFVRAALDTSLYLSVSAKYNPIRVVFDTTLRVCEPTVRVLMPL